MGIDEWKQATTINLVLKQINSSSYGTSALTPIVIGAIR